MVFLIKMEVNQKVFIKALIVVLGQKTIKK